MTTDKIEAVNKSIWAMIDECWRTQSPREVRLVTTADDGPAIYIVPAHLIEQVDAAIDAIVDCEPNFTIVKELP